ncbi:MAG: transposase [Verrucomicrobiota bacterium]|jgi:REP element-mobilizing transposase RayT
MARPLRIEFAGATYHVMARGNQGRAIFDDDRDRQCFLETLAEACDKTGWRIHAYVLMGNHYHLLVETPEANLVAGMKWLQGTYTQRYNGRHEVFGHLFQGRYKAVPVDGAGAGYLETVSTYIHLNPARAGVIKIGKEKLKAYRWSSYPWYLSLPGRGPAWLERRRVMEGLRLKPEDRRGYEVYLEGRTLEIGLEEGRAELEEQWKALRRGWYVGGDGFAAKLRDKIERLVRGCRRESHSGGAKREHGEEAAEQLLRKGLALLGLTKADLAQLSKLAMEKAALAGWLRQRTTVSLRWVSERLGMGHYTNASCSPRRINPTGFRKLQKIRRKLDLMDANEN